MPALVDKVLHESPGDLNMPVLNAQDKYDYPQTGKRSAYLTSWWRNEQIDSSLGKHRGCQEPDKRVLIGTGAYHKNN